MSLALARKYRPHSFEDLIAQESVSQTLSLALDNNRLSHAYLFSGLRGSGKTSTARIFAKALLCQEGMKSKPCGECSNCLMAIENRHIDIIEMDGASNRGIDDIKELIEHTKYKPSIGAYKIFIIDEVHMLTTQAFNALLKTLEEPPSFVKFILATTDPLKLPATILSRTQHFRFKKIPQNLIEEHLKYILDLENIEYEKEALEIIARCGQGSLRDALTLLDQAIVYSKNFVNISTVTDMLGIIDPQKLSVLLHYILSQDKEGLIRFIQEVQDYEASMILDELTMHLKEILFTHQNQLSTKTMDSFFRIIAEAKSILALGSDGDFVLYLTLFKMLESLDKQEKKIENFKPITNPEPIPKIQEIPVIETLKSIEKIEEREEIKEIEKPKETKFETLKAKIYEKDEILGECFHQNIRFKSFEDNKLSWVSKAEEEDKKVLIHHWRYIKLFVQDIFGFETKIVNISAKKTPQIKSLVKQEESPPQKEEIDESTLKSSCIAPEAGQTLSAQEINPSTIMQDKMIKEAIKLFDPSKVRIQRNS